MGERFLCADAECWITPDEVVAHRRERSPDLRVDPSLLYTPLDFGRDGRSWLVDALAPCPASDLGTISIKALYASVDLGETRLSALVGPIGAPATVTTLEVAIALGARRIIFFGVCGSLQPDLRIGDLVLVERALREEGTSYHYLPADEPAVAAPRLLEVAAAELDRAGEPYRRGTIWTTDAPFRETRTKVERLAGQGVLGVEMEVSAVYALARFRGVEALALQIVSDQLVGDRWTGIRREHFLERCQHAVGLIGRIARAIRPAAA